ncbi:MAG: DUF2141 domain-containing protein [Chitinophagaceae bacterium]
MKTIFLITLSWVLVSRVGAQELSVVVQNVHRNQGELLIAVFNQDQGFPFSSEQAVKTLKTAASRSSVAIKIGSLPPGRYALALFQDANQDGKLNTNWLGIPKEGYGVSNNIFPTFRAPHFQEAAFPFPQQSELTIQMKY